MAQFSNMFVAGFGIMNSVGNVSGIYTHCHTELRQWVLPEHNSRFIRSYWADWVAGNIPEKGVFSRIR